MAALDLIWDKELLPGKLLPDEWTEDWRNADLPEHHKDYYVKGSSLPYKSNAQYNVLRMATGTDRHKKLTKYVSKQSYLLIDCIKGIGDFGQHQTTEVTLGFAVTACYNALELAFNLANELY